MVDGPSVNSAWNLAISEAEAKLRDLLGDGKGWRRLSPAPSRETDAVSIYRRGEVYRAVTEVPYDSSSGGAEEWVSVLSTPELRKEWDGSVDSAEIIEVFEQESADDGSQSTPSTFTRLLRTTYGVGWPANPRDSITLHRTLIDGATILDISCSIPTVAPEDEPGYLRVRPPYVRSFVNIMAWCIQIPSVQPLSRNTPIRRGTNTTTFPTVKPKLKLTLFHSHPLRLPLLSSFPIIPYLTSLLPSLVRVVRERGTRIPRLLSYPSFGVGVSILKWDVGREVLSIEYEIWSDGSESDHSRHLHFRLPGGGGWDVRHASTSGNSAPSPSLNPEAAITRLTQEKDGGDVLLTMKHYPPSSPGSQSRPVRVSLRIELVSHSLGIRINGVPAIISAPQSHSQAISPTSPHGVEVASLYTLDASESSLESDSGRPTLNGSIEKSAKELREKEERRQKAILTRVKRNYIYFTSLLQEPEAKWARYTESRGVSVSTLDTLSTSLIIYRAEAVFVGLGIWDLYAGVVGGWIRSTWDKSYEEFDLIEDLGGVSLSGVSELWMERTKGGWGVNPRETVLLRTVYKSPTAVHIFAFSPTLEDSPIFPSIPPPASSSPTAPAASLTYVRTQVDLQGFAIERLSPTTTSVTLLTQSDTGRGWGAMSSLGMGSISKGMGMGPIAASGVPNQLINLMGGMGEYLIKYGAPPVLTSLRGGRTRSGGIKFDAEKTSLKIEYEVSEAEGEALTEPDSALASENTGKDNKLIECELRCDMDVWSPGGVELIVDPPPVSVTAFRRHKLSDASGMWITICHSTSTLYSLAAMADLDDPASEGRIVVIVRKGKSGGVICNGAKIEAQVEELEDKEVQKRARKKRVKPERVPLDVPPSPLKRSRRNADESDDESEAERCTSTIRRRDSSVGPMMTPSTKPPVASSPLARMWKAAVEGTQQAVSAVSPPAPTESEPLDSSKSPAQQALESLSYLRSYHSRAHFDGWAVASTGNEADAPFVVYRKQQVSISKSLPVFKGERVIEGWAAEDVAAFVSNYKWRQQWDDRFYGGVVLEEYGSSFRASFMCLKSVFPFRDRGFLVADALARLPPEEDRRGRNGAWGSTPKSPAPNGSGAVTIFYACVSFHPEHPAAAAYSGTKYNPYTLPVGRVFLDGWIFETLDPYTTTEHYAIPSTRVSRLVSIDFAGSMPAAYTSMINIALPKAILNLENFLLKSRPVPSVRLPGSEWFMEEEDNDLEEDLKWELLGGDQERVLVRAENDSVGKSLHATIRITPQFRLEEPIEMSPRRRHISLSPAARSLSREPPKEDLEQPPMTPTRTSRADTLPSSPPISPETIRRHRRVSSTTNTTSPSIGLPLVRSMPGGSIFTSSTLGSNLLAAQPDFCVAEVVVDPALYGDTGYSVTLHSEINRPGAAPYSSSVAPSADSVSIPLISNIYTVPSGAMHPTRHLLRITLSSSQYFTPAIEDPLTGETKKPTEKPQWLTQLEEHGARIDIQIGPRSKEIQAASDVVILNDNPLRVKEEKESLHSLGRRGLEGEILIKNRGRLRRCLRKSGDESLPKDLANPILVAEEMKVPAASPKAEDHDVSGDADLSTVAVPDTPANQDSVEAAKETTLTTSQIPHRKVPGSFRGFLEPLLRRSSLGTGKSGAATTPSHGDARNSPVQIAVRDAAYPLSTVVIVALISFLLGSLLRSLLTPAEFVAPYHSGGEVSRSEEGWREIKRLVEIKYLVGGWDLVVAVVRRH